MPKYEIYQLGKLPPLTVIEAEEWNIDKNGLLKFCGKSDNPALFGKAIAVFNFNNIAGFKEIHEDKNGYWFRISDGAELQLTCSHCGYEYIEADPDCTEEHNYCPHCGAKMDEEAK